MLFYLFPYYLIHCKIPISRFVFYVIFFYRFERKNNNLYTTVYITVLEALTHFSKTFNHINKKPFTLSKSNVTHDGEVVTLPGLGMPIKTSQSSNQGIKQQAYGDLVVTYRVKYPIFLSAEDQQLIKQALKNVTQWKY
jgi:DnaJ-class molecular chaperone